MRLTLDAVSICNYYIHNHIFPIISQKFLACINGHFDRFGKNSKQTMPKATLKQSFIQEIDKGVYVPLFIAAFVSMITGYISEDGFLGWMQGVSIVVGLVFLVGLGVVNDYLKDKEFIKLQKWHQKGRIGVVRGKKGVSQTISVYKIVVGDVIILEPGCIIPADCLLIEGSDVVVDETPLKFR